jgi:hypothetical protein
MSGNAVRTFIVRLPELSVNLALRDVSGDFPPISYPALIDAEKSPQEWVMQQTRRDIRLVFFATTLRIKS